MASSDSTRKGQVWYVDFTVGVLIFLTMVVFFFIQMNALEERQTVDVSGLVRQAQDISNELMSPGYPSAWNATTVIRIGITDNARINGTKLDALASMDYAAMRKVLRITDEFFAFIERSDGCLVPIGAAYGIGHPSVSVPASGCALKTSVNLDPVSPNTVIPITRFIIYNATPARLNVYVWNS